MKKIFALLLGALVFNCCNAEEVAPLQDPAAASDCHCESDSPLPTPICAVYVKLIDAETKLSGKKIYKTSCAFSCDSAFIIKRLSPYACEETSPYPWLEHEPSEPGLSMRKLYRHFPIEQPSEESEDAPVRKIRSAGIPEWKLPLIKHWMELDANPTLRATAASATSPSWLQWKPPSVQALLGVGVGAGLGLGVGKSGLYNSELGHPWGHGYRHHERIPWEQLAAINHPATAAPVEADEPVTAEAIPVWDLPEVAKE